MLRITGILCGSAITIAVLVLFLGVPEFTDEREVVATLEPPTWDVVPEDDVEYSPAGVTPDETTAATSPNDSTTDEFAAPAEDPEVPLPNDDAALVDAIFAPVEERDVPVVEAAEPDLADAVEQNWYAFWSPFRSEIAANGFVEQLQRSTGIDYRVVRQKPGVYEVAFAYSDDGDIQDKLAAISAATGLEMPGG